MQLIVSFPDDTEVSSGQLKRFNESVIDPKFSLKVEATSFCFDNNLSFLSNIIFFVFHYILYFFLFLYEKYSLQAFQNGFGVQPTLSLQSGLFTQIDHQVSL